MDLRALTSGKGGRVTPPFGLLLATTNRGKIAELGALFADVGVTLVPLASLPGKHTPVVEDGATFLANALLKANAAAQATGMVTLAEDSGLEVDALGGTARRAVGALREGRRNRRGEQRAPGRGSRTWTTISARRASAA